MTLIERVARAILKARQEHGFSGGAELEHEPENIKALYRDSARAAIEAMRPPMMNEVLKSARRHAVHPSVIDLIWCDQIDAALKEEP